jgi:hypothetical protein
MNGKFLLDSFKHLLVLILNIVQEPQSEFLSRFSFLLSVDFHHCVSAIGRFSQSRLPEDFSGLKAAFCKLSQSHIASLEGLWRGVLKWFLKLVNNFMEASKNDSTIQGVGDTPYH